MKKYIDITAYPLGVIFVYVLVALANWDRDPGTWDPAARILWIIWGIAWGEALRHRMRKEVTE